MRISALDLNHPPCSKNDPSDLPPSSRFILVGKRYWTSQTPVRPMRHAPCKPTNIRISVTDSHDRPSFLVQYQIQAHVETSGSSHENSATKTYPVSCPSESLIVLASEDFLNGQGTYTAQIAQFRCRHITIHAASHNRNWLDRDMRLL